MGLAAATVAVLLREQCAEEHRKPTESHHAMTGPQSDNDEADTAPCLPFPPRSVVMGSAAIASPEALRSLRVGVLVRA